MLRRLNLGAIALLVATSTPALAAPPSWVKPADAPATKPTATEGVQWHISDTQIRHTAKQVETYRHHRLSVHDEATAAQWKNLWFARTDEIVFARATRGGKLLPTGKPQLNDEQTAFLIDLPNLEPGDVIDYAWVTREPRDAISGLVDLREGGGIGYRRVRVLVPADAGVEFTLLGPGELPGPTKVGKYVEREWTDQTSSTPTFVPNTPQWYFQSPFLHYTNVESWADLGQLLARRFDVAAPPPKDVEQLAANLVTNPDATELERAVAAASHVQKSFEPIVMSRVDTAPRPPGEVVKLTAATSVERALLLASLARAMGLDAKIGLAHSGYQRKLNALPVSADMLDTALTGVTIDGKVAWIDPTRRDIVAEGFITPPVEMVVVVEPDSHGLLEIPTIVPFEPTLDVLETYVLDGDGAELTLTTDLRREDADFMRRRIGEQSREELAQQFLEATSQYAGDLVVSGPLEIEDDPEANHLHMVEHYRLAEFWNDSEHKVSPYEIVAGMVLPDANRPRIPLAVPHPRHVRHRFRFENLPDEWKESTERKTIETDGFVLDYVGKAKGRSASASWTYRSRASFVADNRLSDYQRGLDTPYYAYRLTWSPPLQGAHSYLYRFWLVIGGFIFFGGALQTLERRRVLRRSTARVMTRSDSQ